MSAPAKLTPMAERYRRPDWVRRLNLMADSVGGRAADIVPLDADELMAAAIADLGEAPAGDFGDPQWRSRFEQLVGAIDASSMHVVGRLMSRQELLRALRTRFLLTRAVEETPAIEDERIEAPVIVTGPARSGTSILFELLWLDPTLRGPVGADVLHPFAAPGGRDAPSAVEMGECEQELWADVQPEFAALHELRSDLPVECVTLTVPCFCGPHWAMVGQLEGYLPDNAMMYDFHRRVLQVMQHGQPAASWLLKTPGHLATLEMVFATYPDAWIVQTHRDPAKTMPSTVSTTAMIQWLRTDAVDLDLLRTVIDATFSHALTHSIELRGSGAVPDRFVDVHFQDLLREPVETLRRAYATMERPFTDEHAERIRAYLAEKPQGKFGKHRYEPEDWGFTAAGLRERLSTYIQHFDVALE